jgi:hypothetical protein
VKIEGVITSVGVADFLAHSLPYNRHQFDQLVVVTAHTDRETQRVCEYWNVRCVLTDRFESHLGHFCKGAGINVGLKALDCDGWVVHLDSDIVVPPLFRQYIELTDLDKSYLYGADRFMVPNFEEWVRFIGQPRLMHENKVWLHMGEFPLGVRVVLDQFQGYTPIGFFQMWHGRKAYVEGHTSAAREDTAFAAKWPRNKRALLGEIVVYHLESEKAAMGANWNGRTTQPFRLPDKPAQAKY